MKEFEGISTEVLEYRVKEKSENEILIEPHHHIMICSWGIKNLKNHMFHIAIPKKPLNAFHILS